MPVDHSVDDAWIDHDGSMSSIDQKTLRTYVYLHASMDRSTCSMQAVRGGPRRMQRRRPIQARIGHRFRYYISQHCMQGMNMRRQKFGEVCGPHFGWLSLAGQAASFGDKQFCWQPRSQLDWRKSKPSFTGKNSASSAGTLGPSRRQKGRPSCERGHDVSA